MTDAPTPNLLVEEMARVGLSIRGLAKKLAGSNDLRLIDNQRTNVRRWLDPSKGITEASSAKLAPHFGRPADFFVRAPQTRARTADRLEALRGDVEALLLEDAQILERLDDIETRLERLERLPARKPTGSTRRGAQS